MPTKISLPPTTTISVPTAQFPASANNGIVENETDANGNTYQWAWNASAGLWLSPNSFFTGLSGQSGNGLLDLNILSTVLTTSVTYSLPGGCLRNQIWLVKSSICALPYGNSTLGGTYFSSTLNQLGGINNYNFALPSFTTNGAPLNQFTIFDNTINQTFNSRLLNWQLTIAKTGLDAIAIRLSFGLEYKLIRY